MFCVNCGIAFYSKPIKTSADNLFDTIRIILIVGFIGTIALWLLLFLGSFILTANGVLK